MSRVRRLNISTVTSGLLTVTPTLTTASWDLETEWWPRFTRRAPVHLVVPMQFYVFDVPDDVLTDVLLAELTNAGLDPLTTD